jgi:hypothetical protein
LHVTCVNAPADRGAQAASGKAAGQAQQHSGARAAAAAEALCTTPAIQDGEWVDQHVVTPSKMMGLESNCEQALPAAQEAATTVQAADVLALTVQAAELLNATTGTIPYLLALLGKLMACTSLQLHLRPFKAISQEHPPVVPAPGSHSGRALLARCWVVLLSPLSSLLHITHGATWPLLHVAGARVVVVVVAGYFW